MWTGRLEAVAVAASAAYAYNKATEYLSNDDEIDAQVNKPWGFDWSNEDDDTGHGIDFGRELAETRSLMRELDSEIAASDPLALSMDKPVDGEYEGETAEDDAGDQTVRTTLAFGRDGSIAGAGYDGVDGDYQIREGRWSQKRVAWFEEYDDGFMVALRGQIRPDGTIVALWASSRCVGGSVTLAAPTR